MGCGGTAQGGWPGCNCHAGGASWGKICADGGSGGGGESTQEGCEGTSEQGNSGGYYSGGGGGAGGAGGGPYGGGGAGITWVDGRVYGVGGNGYPNSQTTDGVAAGGGSWGLSAKQNGIVIVRYPSDQKTYKHLEFGKVVKYVEFPGQQPQLVPANYVCSPYVARLTEDGVEYLFTDSKNLNINGGVIQKIGHCRHYRFLESCLIQIRCFQLFQLTQSAVPCLWFCFSELRPYKCKEDLQQLIRGRTQQADLARQIRNLFIYEQQQ